MRALPRIALVSASLFVPLVLLAAGAPSPQEFVTKASEAGMAEVELSKLALQKSSDPDIKAFAQRMVTDHGKADAELAAIAERKKLMPSAKLSAAHEKALENLRGKSGGDFDDAYSDQMKSDHKEAVELFTEARGTADPELAAFAAKTLPTLKAHEELAAHLDDTH